MSYVGREAFLCRTGHFLVIDIEVMRERGFAAIGRCRAVIRDNKQCREPYVWQYSIDDTNVEGSLPELRQLTRDEWHKCTCKHRHMTATATYEPADPSLWKRRMLATTPPDQVALDK